MQVKANTNSNNLISGKRYWFWSGYHIRSGLYGGETDANNGNAIVCEKDGTRWSIPAEDLYERKENVVKS